MGSELRGRYRRQLTAAMAPRSYTKTYKVPRRPFESARLDSELKVVGEYGLRNKREVWRVQLTLSKIRRAARQLLTLDEKDPKRLFEGNALIRRLVRVGVLDESRMKLDYVLALKVEDFLERRLQTCVYKLGLAKSIHHARVLVVLGERRRGLLSPRKRARKRLVKTRSKRCNETRIDCLLLIRCLAIDGRGHPCGEDDPLRN